MKKFIIVLLVVVAIAAAIFFIFERDVIEEDPLTDLNEMEVNSTPVVEETVTVELFEQNESGQIGFATIEDIEGGSFVSIDVTPGDEGLAQPAHIHFENCANIGGVSYPLNNVTDGLSETLLDVSLKQILDERPLSINVHKSTEEPGIYVACGDI